MSATRSSALLVLAVAVLAGCPRRGVETHPWNIQATTGDLPLWGFASGLGALQIDGQGERVDPATLRITGATLQTDTTAEPIADVVIAFEARSTGVAFPDVPAGSDVHLTLLVDPNGLGPTKEPLRVPAFMLYGPSSLGTRAIFTLSEGTYRALPTDRTATIFNFLDLPSAEIAEQWMRFEPDQCGPVYYDDVVVFGWSGEEVLSPGDQGSIVTREDDPNTVDVQEPTESWTYHHVLSWHRDGACSDQAQAWTQLAAWFDGP